MLRKRRGLTSVLAVLLSLLVVSPQFMVALLTAQTQATTPALINVQTASSLKTLSEFNGTVTIQQCVTLETWTNGTRINISDHDINSTYNVQVNCTTWLDPATTSATSEPTRGNDQTPTFKAQDDSGLYSLTAQGNGTDGLFFLLKGSNGTCFVSYDHDDNYDSRGYYPCEWNNAYALAGANETHVHLAADLLSGWINGNESAAQDVICSYLTGQFSDDIIGDIAAALGCPIPAAVSILLDVYDIINTMIQYYQFVALVSWLRDVVMEQFSGDGWTWRGPIMIYPDAFGVSRRGPTTGGGLPNEYFWYKCIKLVDWYNVTCWQQSWGTDGVFSQYQQDWTVTCWNHLEVEYHTNAVGQ